MTGKEIILKALKFEETPRLPVAILDGYVWMLKRNQLSFKDLCEMEDAGAELVKKTVHETQSDIVNTNVHVFSTIFEVMGGKIRMDKVGEPVEVTRTPLQEMADIEKYDIDEVWEKFRNRPEFLSNIHLIELLKAYYGEEKLIPAMSVGPLSFAGMMMGVQNFMTEVLDEEELAEKMLEFTSEIIVRNCELQIAHGADSIFIAEPVASGDLISPAMFERLSLPYIQRITERLKKYNLPIMLHICGRTQAHLEPLKRAGIDAFSLASVDLKLALETAKGEYAIMGNMDPFAVIQLLTPEEVTNTCRELAGIAGLEGGYIMMPGCDIAPDTALENVQAMVRAVYEKTT